MVLVLKKIESFEKKSCLIRFAVGSEGIATAGINKKKNRGLSAACYAMPVNTRTLQWVSTISSV